MIFDANLQKKINLGKKINNTFLRQPNESLNNQNAEHKDEIGL